MAVLKLEGHSCDTELLCALWSQARPVSVGKSHSRLCKKTLYSSAFHSFIQDIDGVLLCCRCSAKRRLWEVTKDRVRSVSFHSEKESNNIMLSILIEV